MIIRNYIKQAIQLENELQKKYGCFIWSVLGKDRHDFSVDTNSERNFVIRATIRINDVNYGVQRIVEAELVYDDLLYALDIVGNEVISQVSNYLRASPQSGLF